MIRHITETGIYKDGYGAYGAACVCGALFEGYEATEDIVDALMEHAGMQTLRELRATAAEGATTREMWLCEAIVPTLRKIDDPCSRKLPRHADCGPNYAEPHTQGEQ